MIEDSTRFRDSKPLFFFCLNDKHTLSILLEMMSETNADDNSEEEFGGAIVGEWWPVNTKLIQFRPRWVNVAMNS